MTGRRLLALLALLAAIGVPAAALQVACAGRACDAGEREAARVPFCPLPGDLKQLLVNGYREGRSPDVLAVTAGATLWSEAGGTGLRAPWPSVGAAASTAVPIVFAGAGVDPAASVPEGTTLDRIAPTVAEVLGFDRPFPQVRSGTALAGVASGERPRLVLVVAWKGAGSAELAARPEAWPFLASLLEGGAGSLDGETGSLPLDPAATLTTIGTGGLPSQHGITGSFVRNDEGDVVPAFGDGAPVTVIATLAEDLDAASRNRSLVGLVATAEADRGLIGGAWYPDHDRDDVVLARGDDAVIAARRLLAAGYGIDDVPDVLGVVLDGRARSMDRLTRALVAEARRATGSSVLVVVAGTGSDASDPTAVPAASVVRAVEDAVPGEAPVVAADVPGGLFLDQDVLTEQQVTGQVAVDALMEVTGPDGQGMMGDAFQGFAVSFARYC